MNDLQFFISLAIAPVSPIAVIVLTAIYNNSGLTDVKENLRGEIHRMGQVFDLRLTGMERRTVRMERKMDQNLTVVLGKSVSKMSKGGFGRDPHAA